MSNEEDLTLDYATGKLFEPDILTELQFLRSYRRKNPLEPEKALMFAVLAEAVETYQKFVFSRSARGKAVFREAESWLWNEEHDILFSFVSICEIFGLNPAFLRQGLLQWAQKRKRRGSSRKRFQLRAGAGRTRKRTLSVESRVP
jgi:hypothetical protein